MHFLAQVDSVGAVSSSMDEICLINLFEVPRRHANRPVTGITVNSRLVRPGDIYVALPGRVTHGANFIAEAIAAGAVAVLTDEAGVRIAVEANRGRVELLDTVVIDDTPVVVPEDDPDESVRAMMARIAALIYDRPAAAMTMLAVTGTNGKTTTSFLLEAALRAAGRHCGVIGTIGFRLDGDTLEAPRTTVTTPESPELQGLLARMRAGGADSVVMEVSSHALTVGRADAITFDVAGFTNFGRDHLDFHGTVENYFEAKAELFTSKRTRHAVINIDDPRGVELVRRIELAGAQLEGGLSVSTTSLRPGADFYPLRVTIEPDGSSRVELKARAKDKEVAETVEFRCALPGEFNVRNAITALAMLDAIGVDLAVASRGLAEAAVPGRMQRVELGPNAPLVFVDFAHTPQAVSAALQSLRESVQASVGDGQRLLVVLGCGGDRDSAKREPIGAAAAMAADLVIATDDNPRTEAPEKIRGQMLAGAEAAKAEQGLKTEIIDGGDRRSAIRRALELARPGDLVAVLGKGHEVGQEINGRVLPFSDPAVLAEVWASMTPGREQEGQE